MTLNHQSARRLLQQSLEIPLTSEERNALEAHLRTCSACQDYERHLRQLHSQLRRSLPARWPVDTAAGSFIQNIDQVESRIRQRRRRQQFWSAAQSVVGPLGGIALIVAIVGLFTALRPDTASSPSNIETPIDIDPPLSSDSTSHPCMAVATVDTSIHVEPVEITPILGTLSPGEDVSVKQILDVLDNQSRWLSFDYGGRRGWALAVNFSIKGDCPPATEGRTGVDLAPTATSSAATSTPAPTWPTPTVTSTPTPYPAATIAPTSTLAPWIDNERVTYIRSTIGSTAQITRTLPAPDGSVMGLEAIRVNLFESMDEEPLNGARRLTVLVQCTGNIPQNLQWGYDGSEMALRCGQSVDAQVTQDRNLIVFAFSIPADGATAVEYTITITVKAP